MPEDDDAICPHCKKAVGVENNPYMFRTVNFAPEVGGRRVQGAAAVRVISITCTNCKRILGFVNA